MFFNDGGHLDTVFFDQLRSVSLFGIRECTMERDEGTFRVDEIFTGLNGGDDGRFAVRLLDRCAKIKPSTTGVLYDQDHLAHGITAGVISTGSYVTMYFKSCKSDAFQGGVFFGEDGMESVKNRVHETDASAVDLFGLVRKEAGDQKVYRAGMVHRHFLQKSIFRYGCPNSCPQGLR